MKAELGEWLRQLNEQLDSSKIRCIDDIGSKKRSIDDIGGD